MCPCLHVLYSLACFGHPEDVLETVSFVTPVLTETVASDIRVDVQSCYAFIFIAYEVDTQSQ